MTTPPRTTHPSYMASDADLVLETADHVILRVHPLIMKMASGMFNDMMGIPRDMVEGKEEPIPISESGSTFVILLNIIYPDAPTPERISLTDMQLVADAARKYDMLKVVSYLRTSFKKHVDLSAEPLKWYALACKYNWQEEAKLASTHTLGLDLREIRVREDLRVLDTESLLQLQELHRARIQGVMKELRIVYRASHTSTCVVSTDPNLGVLAGLACTRLENRVLAEMEACPSGATVRNQAFWDKVEFSEIWTQKCTSCTKAIPTQSTTQSAIVRALDVLPKVVMEMPTKAPETANNIRFSFIGSNANGQRVMRGIPGAGNNQPLAHFLDPFPFAGPAPPVMVPPGNPGIPVLFREFAQNRPVAPIMPVAAAQAP